MCPRASRIPDSQVQSMEEPAELRVPKPWKGSCLQLRCGRSHWGDQSLLRHVECEVASLLELEGRSGTELSLWSQSYSDYLHLWAGWAHPEGEGEGNRESRACSIKNPKGFTPVKEGKKSLAGVCVPGASEENAMCSGVIGCFRWSW